MLKEYLQKNYIPLQPILFSDLLELGISKSNLSQQLSKLCKKGELVKYDKGIYYLPKKTRLSQNIVPSGKSIAEAKYLFNKGKVYGYYSGNTFANLIGISTQVPQKLEIVTNNISAKYKEEQIGRQLFIIRKTRVPITDKNVRVVQVVDLLNNLDSYLDDGNLDNAKNQLQKYIKNNQITKEDVDRVIFHFPDKVFKIFYELRLEDVFTH
ncbi:DUF6088 family protein [Enterococcus cecorum]|uniref:DUF6088 family protein n=1 Tax=Enterococcus cecorum TaxID=44008 RepID=UPI00200B7184|nr:DUF6088 family protein [Enterococcus cecorum]